MQFETWLHTDLQKPLNVVELDTSFFTQDEDANIIGVEITDNGTPVELTGNVHGYIISASGTTVPIDGTKSGNRAQITLNKNCYLDPGGISIAIKIGTTTVAACHGYVHRTETDTVVDPDHIIPSITEIIEQIRLCEQATTAANTATQNANQATTAANTATQNANNAANAINGLTTHAQNGQQSGAVVSTIDGHKHIEFTFPTVIPNLSDVETNTLTPGSNASVIIDTSSPYSLEAPHLTFNIPQGATGTITNAFGTNIQISESDSTTIKAYIDAAKTNLNDLITKRLISHTVSFTLPTTTGINGNPSLTADHVLLAYQFYDANGNATPDTLADFTWTTGDGSLNINVSKVYEAGSMVLVFGVAPSLVPGGGS